MREFVIAFAILASLMAVKEKFYDKPREKRAAAARYQAERLKEDAKQEKCWSEERRQCDPERELTYEQLQSNLDDLDQMRKEREGR